MCLYWRALRLFLTVSISLSGAFASANSFFREGVSQVPQIVLSVPQEARPYIVAAQWGITLRDGTILSGRFTSEQIALPDASVPIAVATEDIESCQFSVTMMPRVPGQELIMLREEDAVVQDYCRKNADRLELHLGGLQRGRLVLEVSKERFEAEKLLLLGINVSVDGYPPIQDGPRSSMQPGEQSISWSRDIWYRLVPRFVAAGDGVKENGEVVPFAFSCNGLECRF
jgi:hypothetical protein